MGHGILLSGGSDVDFTIHGVFQYSFFGHPVWITTSHVCILIVMLLLIAFAIAANRCMAKASEVPGSFQNVVEMIVEMLDNMVSGSMGQAAPKFFNYIGTIFIFILVSNISGLLGLRPPTADYGVTLPLAILTFSMIHYNKWKYQKPMTIWTDLCSPASRTCTPTPICPGAAARTRSIFPWSSKRGRASPGISAALSTRFSVSAESTKNRRVSLAKPAGFCLIITKNHCKKRQ